MDQRKHLTMPPLGRNDEANPRYRDRDPGLYHRPAAGRRRAVDGSFVGPSPPRVRDGGIDQAALVQEENQLSTFTKGSARGSKPGPKLREPKRSGWNAGAIFDVVVTCAGSTSLISKCAVPPSDDERAPPDTLIPVDG